MQQVKEPHARLWREKPADTAGLTQQLMFLTQTHGLGPGREGGGTNPFCSSYLGRPLAHAQSGLGAGHSLRPMESPVLR